jgi:hypothetical protein
MRTLPRPLHPGPGVSGFSLINSNPPAVRRTSAMRRDGVADRTTLDEPELIIDVTSPERRSATYRFMPPYWPQSCPAAAQAWQTSEVGDRLRCKPRLMIEGVTPRGSR